VRGRAASPLYTGQALAAGGALAQSRQRERPRNPQGGFQGGEQRHRRSRGDGRAVLQVLFRAARFDEAEPRARAAVAQLETRSPESWVFAWALSNLGHVLNFRGRLAEARPVVERARAVMERLPATTAPATRAGILGRLGRLRQAEGRADEALALAREAVVFREQAFAAGIDPPNLAAQTSPLRTI
jgi:ATP/maltotriose-dependent transcriptional regulator MalT